MQTPSAARDFIQGLNVWLLGWRAIFSERRLLLVAAVPFLLSFVAAVVSIWATWVYYPVILNAIMPAWIEGLTGFWRAVIYQPVAWIGAFVAVIFSFYLVYVLHQVVAIPFYSVLAERTLFISGKRPTSGSGYSWQMVRVGLVKSVVFLGIGLFLFIFSFIPVLNIFALAGALLLLAFDCLDYSLEASQLGFRQRLRYAFSAKSQWAGMGGALALTLLIPGLTLLVIPGAVVGAALILKDTERFK